MLNAYYIAMQEKQCRRCGTTKPINEFHVYTPSPDGRRALCKSCHRTPVGRELSQQAFWQLVNVGDANECWEWTKTLSSTGYGVIQISGRQRYAHRLAWEFTFGRIGTRLFVCHKCDNRKCCNPSHMFLGTNEENTADRHAKGRDARGLRSSGSKLSPQSVREIRALAADGVSYSEIGRRYDVWPNAVKRVVARETWKHVA